MKKTLLIVSLSSLIFAQSNVISDNNITVNKGDVNINQSNTISNEQIEIDRKIDNAKLNLLKSNYDNSTKNFLTALHGEAEKINKEQIPTSEKNRKCNFKIKFFASNHLFKFANFKLGISFCNNSF